MCLEFRIQGVGRTIGSDRAKTDRGRKNRERPLWRLLQQIAKTL
jgi:hypothetical protein